MTIERRAEALQRATGRTYDSCLRELRAQAGNDAAIKPARGGKSKQGGGS